MTYALGLEGTMRALQEQRRRRDTSPVTAGPSTTELEVQLAEARTNLTDTEMLHRLQRQHAAAQRREREVRITSRPSEPIPETVGNPYARNRPMPPTPGMRRRISTSQGEFVVYVDDIGEGS